MGHAEALSVSPIKVTNTTEDFGVPGTLKIILLLTFIWAFTIHWFKRLGIKEQTPTGISKQKDLEPAYLHSACTFNCLLL